MAKTTYTVEYFYGNSSWIQDFDSLSKAVEFINDLPNRKNFNGTILPFSQAKVLKNNTYMKELPGFV